MGLGQIREEENMDKEQDQRLRDWRALTFRGLGREHQDRGGRAHKMGKTRLTMSWKPKEEKHFEEGSINHVHCC